MDEVMKMFIIFILVIVGLILWGSNLDNNSNIKYRAWAQKCVEDGGSVSYMGISKRSLLKTTYQYECTKDGEIINKTN